MSSFEIKLKTVADPTSFAASVKSLTKTIPPIKIKALFDLPLTSEIDKTNQLLRGLRAEGTISAETYKNLSTEVSKVEENMSKGNITFEQGTKQLNKIQNAAKGVSGGFKGMVADLGSVIAKFSLWYLIAGAVTGVIKLLKDMVDTVVKLDAAMVELNKVYDATQEELDAVADKAYKAANALAATGIDVIKSITNFKRMGYSIEEAEKLGELAIVMTNIGDNIGSASEAADTLGSILKGLGVDSSYALSILDRLNEISNNNAISFDHLSKMLQQSAATMRILGNNLDETLGLLTAGYEVLQNDKVAKGIQTIGLRIAGLNEDLSVSEGLANDVSKALLKFADVSVWDETTGQLKNTYQVLGEVAEKWDEIGKTGGAQEALLNTLAGKQRADVASAILGNWKAVKKAMEDAANSEGSALKENQRYIESIEGHAKRLENTLQDIGRKLIESDIIKGVIDIGNALAQVLGYILKFLKYKSDIEGATRVFETLKDAIVILGELFNKMSGWLDTIKGKLKPITDFFDKVNYYIGFGWLKDLISPSAKLDQEYKDIAETFEEAKKQVSEYDRAMTKLKRTLMEHLDIATSELDALKEKNEQLEKEQAIQDKLLETQKAQMALEEARRKRTTVFRIGKGFVQDEDTAEVQSAQEGLQKNIDDLSKLKYDYALDRTESFITKLKELITNGDIIDGWEDLFNSFGDLLNTEFSSYIASAKEFVDEFKTAMAEAGVDIELGSRRAVTRQALGEQIETLQKYYNETEDAKTRESLRAQIAELQESYNKIANAISTNANGTSNFKGGLTWVGERGPEIVSLPQGSQVLDNTRSMSLKSMVDSGTIGSALGGTILNFNGSLEFPNVSSGEDARSFIDELISIGRNSIPKFS